MIKITKFNTAYSIKQVSLVIVSLTVFFGIIGFIFLQIWPIKTKALPKAKNVILVTFDGLRQDHISFFGYNRLTTPNLDWIARQGISFRNVTPAGSYTKCSLTSLFISLDCNEHRTIEHESILSDEYFTLAEVFQSAGYSTAGFIATPMLTKNYNYNQGFSVFNDFRKDKSDFIRASQVVSGIENFLIKHSEAETTEPFYIYAHFEEPHPPWIPPSPWHKDKEESYSTRPFNTGCTYIPTMQEFANAKEEGLWNELIDKYDGAILQADRQFGRILAILDQLNYSNNTIIAVSTDHGYELLDRYSFTHARNPFDEVTKVFLILYEAGKSHSVDLNTQARMIDIAPTLIGMAGLTAPPNYKGVNLFTESDKLSKYAYSHCYGATVVRSGKFKLIHFFPFHKPVPNNYADYLLYNLAEDPAELTDSKEKYPDIFKEMSELLIDYENKINQKATIKKNDISQEELQRLRTLGYIS